MTLDEFFAGRGESRKIFEALAGAIAGLGDYALRVSKSQVVFCTSQGRTFAWAWTPGRYLRGKAAPLVLTLSLTYRDPSPRWKQIVEPSPGRFTHHLELHAVDDIDPEVRDWLNDAQQRAAKRMP